MDSAGPPLLYVIGTPFLGGLVGLWLGGKIASAKKRTVGRVVGAALGGAAGYGVFYVVANRPFATATPLPPQAPPSSLAP